MQELILANFFVRIFLHGVITYST